MLRDSRTYRCAVVFLAILGVSLWHETTLAQESDTGCTVSEERIEELIGQLAHEDFLVRERATERLRGIGMPAVPRLRQARNSDDPEVRVRARRILNSVELGVPEDAPQQLVDTLRNFKSIPGSQRHLAMKRVVDHMGVNALPFLLARAEEDTQAYSPYAVRLIKDMDPEVVKPFLRESIGEPRSTWAARLKAWAGEMPKGKSVPAAPGEMTLDASKEDWQGIKALPRPLGDDEPGMVMMSWSDKGLHVYYEIADGAINVSPDSPWTGDSLELFLDPGLDRNLTRNASDLQLGFMPAGQPGAGRVKIIFSGARVRKLDEGAVRCVWKKTQNGYGLEGLVTAEVLKPMAMEAGARMGMNYAVNNNGRPVEQFGYDKNEHAGWESPILWTPMVLGKAENAAEAPDETNHEEDAE